MATMIVTAQPNPDFADEAQAYVGQALTMLLEAGGTLLKRVRVQKPVVGEQTFALSLVMDFPDAETIEGVFSSEDYARIAPHRDKGFAFMNILICEDL
ncbi:MAG: DUF1330 domain-containing protein [Pseudomonadota bacterium]